jgi:hypothetical protein
MSDLRTHPQRVGLVDGFLFVGRHLLALVLVPLFLLHDDGQGDVVGILADDSLQLPAAGELVLALAQVQRDVGAAAGLFHHLDGEIALAAGFPAHGLIGLDAGAAGNDGHLVGDDERGIETDAELADQVGILGLVAGQRREEFAGAGFGDGAEVLDRLVASQADAVVGDGDGARRLVEGDADLQIAVVAVQRAVVQRLEAQLVAGVGGVGNQFAQEYLLVAVQGVDHQVQQLFDFGLETQGFAVLRRGCGFGHSQNSHSKTKGAMGDGGGRG